MREYKFRVWNDFIKKYETLQEVASRGAIMPRGNELKTTVNYPLIIEQFTGLHDKNGVEIYEGDNIIFHQFLFDGDEYENQLIGQVIYDDNQACYCLTNIKNEQVQEYMGYKDDYTNFQKETVPINLFYGLHEESFEVIGNIHNNEVKA